MKIEAQCYEAQDYFTIIPNNKIRHIFIDYQHYSYPVGITYLETDDIMTTITYKHGGREMAVANYNTLKEAYNKSIDVVLVGFYSQEIRHKTIKV